MNNPTHELEVKQTARNKIQAFDKHHHRSFLEPGLYPCIRIPHPLTKDEDDEVYELLDFEEPTYVRLDLLENQIDHQFWRVYTLD